MAQQDKGLIIRGLLLFTGVGILVLIVLGILFWRPSAPERKTEMPPEYYVTALLASPMPFPEGISWPSIYRLSETLPSAPGWDIRYNAAATLARRGSPDVPWHLIREMLDENAQLRNHRVRHEGRDVYDEAEARRTMLSALRAVAAWHEKQPEMKHEVTSELREVYAMVDKLAESPYVELRVQAEKTRATFKRPK